MSVSFDTLKLETNLNRFFILNRVAHHNDIGKVRRKSKSQSKAWQPNDYTESEAKRCVCTDADPMSVPQPPGPSSPAYGYQTTAKRWPSFGQVSTDWARGGRRANSHCVPLWGGLVMTYLIQLIYANAGFFM